MPNPIALDDPDTQPVQRPIDARLVYVKTTAGAAEVMERKLPLSNGARRMLIVIDGQRRLSDLPAFARPGELGAMIEELESQRLIALSGIAEEAPEEQRQARQRIEESVLSEIKLKMGGAFTRELGESAGEVLEARLADAVNVDVAKRVLRDGIDAVSARIGKEVALKLILEIKPILNRLL